MGKGIEDGSSEKEGATEDKRHRKRRGNGRGRDKCNGRKGAMEEKRATEEKRQRKRRGNERKGATERDGVTEERSYLALTYLYYYYECQNF